MEKLKTLWQVAKDISWATAVVIVGHIIVLALVAVVSAAMAGSARAQIPHTVSLTEDEVAAKDVEGKWIWGIGFVIGDDAVPELLIDFEYYYENSVTVFAFKPPFGKYFGKAQRKDDFSDEAFKARRIMECAGKDVLRLLVFNRHKERGDFGWDKSNWQFCWENAHPTKTVLPPRQLPPPTVEEKTLDELRALRLEVMGLRSDIKDLEENQ